MAQLPSGTLTTLGNWIGPGSSAMSIWRRPSLLASRLERSTSISSCTRGYRSSIRVSKFWNQVSAMLSTNPTRIVPLAALPLAATRMVATSARMRSRTW